MGKYILKRVLQFIPVFIGVTIILFAMKAIVPGDPISMITGGRAVPEQTRLQLEVQNNMIYGDENGQPIYDENGETIPVPIWEQYIRYMDDLLHGDLGTSYSKKRPVTDIFAEKYPYTIRLAACAICLEAIMGIGAGLISAVKRYSFWDVLVTLVTSVLVAVPAFWLGMMLAVLFALRLGWLPASGVGSWKNYVLPMMTLGFPYSARILRSTRTYMLEAIRQDFVRTARSKGVPERRVVWKHAFTNACLPIINTIGVYIGSLLGGAVVTETVFGCNGLGSFIINSVKRKDIPAVTGGTVFLAIIFSLILLAVDLLYAVVDPRIKAGGTGNETV